jgi:hypothetical protein
MDNPKHLSLFMLKQPLLFICMICLARTTISAQPIVSNAVEKFPNKYSWTFENKDILQIRIASFARSIAQHQDPSFKFFWDNLPEMKKQIVLDYQAHRFSANSQTSRELDQQFRTNIVPELNSIVLGPLIYTEGRFSTDILDSDTRALLARHPKDNALAHLNRMLLEDAFREFVAKRIRIVVEPNGSSYALVDYDSKKISFYDNENRFLSSISVMLTMAKQPGGLHNSFGDPNPQLKVRYPPNRDGTVIATIGAAGGSIDIKTGKFSLMGND